MNPDSTRYCSNCGRSIPLDARICPYCAVKFEDTIPMAHKPVIQEPVPEKDDKTKILLIVLVVIIVAIVITVAIAATVYVYTTGMISHGTTETENAAVIARATNEDTIMITLAAGGQNYGSGYTDFAIYVDGEVVGDLSNVGIWVVGEGIEIGTSATGYEVGGNALSSGDYAVTVTILDTVVFDSEVSLA